MKADFHLNQIMDMAYKQGQAMDEAIDRMDKQNNK